MAARRRRPWRGRLAARAGGLLLAATTAAGCAPSSPLGDPRGVDQLVIPTPSPDAADFADRVDHPWLPLDRGASWTMRVSGPDGTGTRRVEVLPEPVAVAGVPTTAVRSVTVVPGAPRQRRTDLVAEDERGNVWWFGREGEWRAGERGAQAGLLLAAEPRVGDGYRAAYLPGGPDLVTTVTQVDGVLVLEHVTDGDRASTVTETYREGVGLVERVETRTGVREVRE